MMRKVRTAVLTGMAALAVAGVSLAAAQHTHTVKVGLPDGSVAQIEYSGGVAPGVVFAPVWQAMPVALADGFVGVPFMPFDNAASEMDAQVAALIHQTAQLPALPVLTHGKLETAASDKLPQGIMHYELVSTSSGSHSCTRGVQMISFDSGRKPYIVSISSGDCRPLNRASVPVREEGLAHPQIPGLTKPRIEDSAEPNQIRKIV